MAQVGFLVSLCLMLLVPPVVPEEQPQLAESRVEIPISDPKVQKGAALAVQSFNTHSSSEYYYKALKILKAESQVVEGIKYYLTIDLVRTNCKKEMGYDLPQDELEKCEIAPQAEQQKYNCEFEVWLNQKKTDSGIQTWKRLSWRCRSKVPFPASK